MQTAVTKRGQTVIPAALRRRYGIREGDRIEWIDEGGVFRVVPVGRDPVAALRGRGRGQGLTRRLLDARREDRDRER
ncbi:AbrB/MazE/SpoVT family DNA-binding domain-containing protein [Deferrisoma palaeochoriense]